MHATRVPRGILACLIGISVLASCSPKSAATDTGPTVQQLAGTIAAATINAGQQATATSAVPPTAPAATATIMPTLFISAASSACRSGPGADFRVITTFSTGMTLNLVGRDSADSYWIVQDPVSHSECWIQIQDGTAAGSFDLLSQMTPQVSTQNGPAKPIALRWPFFCSYDANTGYTVTVQLSWMDPANDQNGFRVYRGNAQIAELPATATTYKDTVSVPTNTVIIYGIAAYNDSGESSRLNTPGGPKGGSNPVACNTPIITATP